MTVQTLYGEWEVDRECIEEFILESFKKSLQKDVEEGRMTQGEAIRMHVQFQQSEAFRQAVDGAIKKFLSDMAERDASGKQLH